MAADQEKTKAKNLERDMVYQATYGDKPERIASELENPAQPETEAEYKFRKNPLTLDMIKARARSRNMADFRRPEKPPHDESEAALSFISGFDPNTEIETGKDASGKPIKRKITRGDIERHAASRFKTVKFQSDPRFKEAFGRYGTGAPEATPANPESKPGLVADVATHANEILQNFMGKYMGGAKTEPPQITDEERFSQPLITDLERKTAGLPLEGDAPTPEADPGIGLDEQPIDDNEILGQFPDAVQLTDGGYAVQDENGDWHRIKKNED